MLNICRQYSGRCAASDSDTTEVIEMSENYNSYRKHIPRQLRTLYVQCINSNPVTL